MTADDQVGGRALVSAPAPETPAASGNVASGAIKPAPTAADPKTESIASKTGSGTPAGGNSDWGKTLDKGVQVAGTDPEDFGQERHRGPPFRDRTSRRSRQRAPFDHRKAPVRLAERDPNAAWGDGVSTDAPALGSIHSGGRAHLMAGGAPAPQALTAAPGTAHTHAIQQGETLSSIAASAYGSASAYTHILKANPGLNPNALKIGAVINLPAIDQVKAASALNARLQARPAPVAAPAER